MASPFPLQVLLVPSAFTVKTGEAHWEILLRARAIECQCYVSTVVVVQAFGTGCGTILKKGCGTNFKAGFGRGEVGTRGEVTYLLSLLWQVLAAAQAGRHNHKRESYGHALIIDPWGTIIARCKGTMRCSVVVQCNAAREQDGHATPM